MSELASWSTNATCSYNRQVLTISGSLGYDETELLQEAHFSLERGYVYGLIGPNGSGKTSLARSLTMNMIPGFPAQPENDFSVEYTCPHVLSAYQEENQAKTARQYCLGRINQRIQQLQRKIDQLEIHLDTLADDKERIEDLTEQLSELYDSVETLESSSRAKLDQLLQELGFMGYADLEYSKLSSGWRYKCELVSSMLSLPDCMIVDEPSFLDASSMDWFVSQAKMLVESKNAMFLLISHKEEVLRQACDRILYLNPASKKLFVYNCSYDEFLAAYSDQLLGAQRAAQHADHHSKQAKESLDSLRKQLDKRERNFKETTTKNADRRWIKGKNKEAKQKADNAAASKVKRLADIVQEAQEQEALMRQAKIPLLHLEGRPSSTPNIVTIVDMSFRHQGSQDVLFEYVDAQMSSIDKVLLTGGNGQGKSTLVKLIMGELEPTGGEIRRWPGRITYFPQDALSGMVQEHGKLSSVDLLCTENPNLTLTDARQHLGSFGIKGKVAMRSIQTLSAGQRVRLWLAMQWLGGSGGSSDECKPPSLLILDEITENLDRETVKSLNTSLSNFNAAVLAISHDKHFCGCFQQTQVWKLDSKRLRVEMR